MKRVPIMYQMYIQMAFFLHELLTYVLFRPGLIRAFLVPKLASQILHAFGDPKRVSIDVGCTIHFAFQLLKLWKAIIVVLKQMLNCRNSAN